MDDNLIRYVNWTKTKTKARRQGRPLCNVLPSFLMNVGVPHGLRSQQPFQIGKQEPGYASTSEESSEMLIWGSLRLMNSAATSSTDFYKKKCQRLNPPGRNAKNEQQRAQALAALMLATKSYEMQSTQNGNSTASADSGAVISKDPRHKDLVASLKTLDPTSKATQRSQTRSSDSHASIVIRLVSSSKPLAGLSTPISSANIGTPETKQCWT